MIVNPNISYDEPLQSYGPSGNIQVGGGGLFGLRYGSCPAMKTLKTESKIEANQGFKTLLCKIPFKLRKKIHYFKLF